MAISGLLADSLSTTANFFDVVKGRIYRVRYRVRNDIGWSSDYSPIGYVKAADVPARPPAPIFISGSATKVDIALQPTSDNGGAELEGYEVWADDGALGETFTKLESYDGLSHSFSIDLSVEILLQ